MNWNYSELSGTLKATSDRHPPIVVLKDEERSEAERDTNIHGEKIL